ncbi:MAG TPA: hypothetical protein VE174_13975 [Actinomycetota bacterium]|nr:hypothetical protein [Actinomycetota bacterium]
MKALGGVPLEGRGWVRATKWAPGGALTAAVSDDRNITLNHVDVNGMTLLESESFTGELIHSEAVDHGLVIASAPRSIGPITIIYVSDGWAISSAVIGNVVGGGSESESGVLTEWRPAMAVDRRTSRVAVVGESTASLVDLADMSVDDVDLGETSWLGRLMAWFVPPANAKEPIKSSVRFGHWLGTALAVTGSNSTLDPQDRITSAGLSLIDAANARSVLVDEQVSGIEVASGRMLAFDHTGQRDSREEPDREGIGVIAYDEHGRELWHSLGRRYVSGLQVVGCLAYVEAGWLKPQTAIVDVRSGRVIDLLNQYPPTLLGEVAGTG